ncbi:hypothetical protein BGX28_009295 [Mortierella sp. GBA30]|nr:hypothetical protein BGX28_009295 [Mortierella sp. GBA30]
MENEFDTRPLRPGSLIWSEDNILALVTPATIHLVAPSLCGAVDQSSTKFFVSSISAGSLDQEKDQKPWKLMMHVASIRNAVSEQAMEFAHAAWSPTGCSHLKGCMLACITLRHSVVIYLPSSSRVDGPWRKHVVLDKYLAVHWEAEQEIDLEMADKVESVSLAWSPKIFIDNVGSLLALGNKAGHITFWNVSDADNIRCVKSLETSGDTWVTRMSWSPWTVEGDYHISMLAYSMADGAVHVRKVRFNSEAPLENIEISENIMDTVSQSLHPSTILRWSPTVPEAADRPNMLAFSKGSRLNIWLPETKKILVRRKPIAKAIAEISWDTFGKKVFVFFMDGKHSVYDIEQEELVTDEDSVDFVHQNIISRCHMQTRTNLTQEEGEADTANADDDGGDEETGGGAVSSKLQLHIICGDRSAEGMQLATAY